MRILKEVPDKMALLPGSDSFQCPNCGNSGSYAFTQENRVTVSKVFSLNTLYTTETKIFYVCTRCSTSLDPNKQYSESISIPETVKRTRGPAKTPENGK